MAEQLPQDIIARLRALDPTINPALAQASWALLIPLARFIDRHTSAAG